MQTISIGSLIDLIMANTIIKAEQKTELIDLVNTRESEYKKLNLEDTEITKIINREILEKIEKYEKENSIYSMSINSAARNFNMREDNKRRLRMGLTASLSNQQSGPSYPTHEHHSSEASARNAKVSEIAASRISAEKEEVQRFLQKLDEYLDQRHPFINKDNIEFTRKLEEYYNKKLISEAQYNKFIMELQKKRKKAITLSGMANMNNTNAGGGYLSKKQRKNKSRKNKTKSHKNKSRKTKKH